MKVCGPLELPRKTMLLYILVLIILFNTKLTADTFWHVLEHSELANKKSAHIELDPFNINVC
jgi:hypothetical protein